jgi:probable F420-dependent oxidoreductase
MDIGVKLGHGLGATTVRTGNLARLIEELGYHSIWLAEHTVIPTHFESKYPYTSNGDAPFPPDMVWSEAMTGLGFIAGRTERVRLGTAVLPAICRNPVFLAKQIATLDTLSGGRVELGIGAGWLKEEAVILGQPVDSPSKRLREAIRIMRQAWTSPTWSYEGEFWNVPEVAVRPLPPQGDQLPIWIGGLSKGALQTASDLGTGVIVMSAASAEDVKRVRADLPADKRVAAGLRLSGLNATEAAARASELEEAGADLLMLNPTEDDTSAEGELERFAEQVFSHR